MTTCNDVTSREPELSACGCEACPGIDASICYFHAPFNMRFATNESNIIILPIFNVF